MSLIYFYENRLCVFVKRWEWTSAKKMAIPQPASMAWLKKLQSKTLTLSSKPVNIFTTCGYVAIVTDMTSFLGNAKTEFFHNRATPRTALVMCMYFF